MDTLKKYWLIIAIAILGIIIFLTYRSCRQDTIIDSYQVPNKVDTTSIVKKWKDKYEREHTLAKIQSVNYANLLNAKDEEMVKLREDINADKSITAKSVIGIKTSQNIKTTVRDSIVYRYVNDTVSTPERLRLFNYIDEWMTLRGEITPNDSLVLDYEVKNKLSIFTKYKSIGFLKPKDIYLEIVQENPKTTTDKVLIYQVQQPPVGFLQSRIFNIGIGFLVGAFAAQQLSK